VCGPEESLTSSGLSAPKIGATTIAPLGLASGTVDVSLRRRHSCSPMAAKPSGSASRYGARNSPAILRKTIVEADCARTEGRDLEQATCHHHVLEEVDHLILVGEVAVERHRHRNREPYSTDLPFQPVTIDLSIRSFAWVA